MILYGRMAKLFKFSINNDWVQIVSCEKNTAAIVYLFNNDVDNAAQHYEKIEHVPRISKIVSKAES